MKLPTFSRRQLFASASLLLVGFALVAIAIQLSTGFSLDIDAIAQTFSYVGLTLIGAVVILPALNSGTARSLSRIRLTTLSRRAKFSASLLLLGLTFWLLSHFEFSLALTFRFVSFTLIGAGALYPSQRPLSAGLIGFIIAVVLTLPSADTDGINANETFNKVAEEIAASHAESDEDLNDTSATPSQQGRSD
jgi:hypothetical protein